MDVRHPTRAALADLLGKVITAMEGGTDDRWSEFIDLVHHRPIVEPFGPTDASFLVESRASAR
jgi:hypothetical protein